MLVLRIFVAIVLLTLDSAAAQTPPRPTLTSGGITVTGKGTVAAAPDRARVSVTIFGSIGAAAPGFVPLDEAAAAFRSALQANGVTDVREVFPIGTLSGRNVAPAIVGFVAKPTRERLESIARGVVKAVPDRFAPAFANSQFQVALLVDDCTAAEERAERAAFADARDRATRVAAIAGVRLGAVQSIIDAQAYQNSGCGSKPDTIDAAPSQMLAPYGALVLPVTVSETVTFAIVGP